MILRRQTDEDARAQAEAESPYLTGDDMPGIIYAATPWKTNSELIAAAAQLYLDGVEHVLDPTRGVRRRTSTGEVLGLSTGWWSIWRPPTLIEHDLAWDGVDFRNLPYEDDWFDAAAFDPEYAPSGGHETSTLQNFQTAYGRGEGTTATDADGQTIVLGSENPQECQQKMHDGLAEVARVVRPRRRGDRPGIGRILAKSQGYIWNGKWWDGTRKLENFGESIGLEVVYRFEHITSPKPQPKRSTCVRCGAKIQWRTADRDRRGQRGWAAMRRALADGEADQARTDEPWRYKDLNDEQILEDLNRRCPLAPQSYSVSTEVDGETVQGGTVPPEDHRPDLNAKVQDHAHRNCSSLTIFEVSARPPAALFG